MIKGVVIFSAGLGIGFVLGTRNPQPNEEVREIIAEGLRSMKAIALDAKAALDEAQKKAAEKEEATSPEEDAAAEESVADTPEVVEADEVIDPDDTKDDQGEQS